MTCFGLVFFGHYLVGLAQATEILLFLVGTVLLVIEVFTPAGVAGISGILCIMASSSPCRTSSSPATPTSEHPHR